MTLSRKPPFAVPSATESIRILPLGGLGEIGLNMMVVEYRDKILIIDCGLMFPESNMMGIDYAIPDVIALADRGSDIVGLILTHGHEDHIGAVPFLLERLGNPPVFGTPLTLGLLQGKLEEHDLEKQPDLRLIDPAVRLPLPPFEVEFFRAAHSIVDGVGLAIRTPAGLVVHTGDFKLDPSPLDGQGTDLERLRQLGDEGTLLLFSDSTNVESPGHTPSEREVGKMFAEIFPRCRGWIMVAAFASNIHRIQQAIDAARANNRRILITGRSMQMVCRVGRELGYLHFPDHALIGLDDLGSLPRDRVFIITTGSQGEFRSVLTRVALGEHRQLRLEKGDVVILSSKFIPGNEKSIHHTINNLFRRGAEVYYQTIHPVHVSGHAGRDDLLEVISLVRPRFFVPVHGEYRHLVQHARLAGKAGLAPENTLVIENGQPLTVSWEGCRLEESVHSGRTLVDGKGVGDLGFDQLRDRRQLAHHGMVVVQIVLEAGGTRILNGPQFHTRGFIPQEEKEYYDLAGEVIRDLLAEGNADFIDDRDLLREEIRRRLQRFFNRTLQKRPMVLPLVLEK
ncbi:MAG: ribonuclease J [Desulfuromonadaceae bacterium]|nr:ribonuclease J [Desulfuromonadaceae bacterium]